ncbi:MAG: hypothetical protein ABFC80_04835 [Coriobacteriales bacterium]
MKQASERTCSGSTNLEEYLEQLIEHAVACWGVSKGTARYAARATEQHLAPQIDGGILDARAQSRVRGYFRAVVRRRALSDGAEADAEYRLRLRVATLAEELGRAGMDASAIRREAVGFYGPDAAGLLPWAVA